MGLIKRIAAVMVRRAVLVGALEVAGFACLVIAAWRWEPTVGIAALGAALVLAAQGAER